MKTASPRTSRLHSEGMNAEIKATTRCFDERADFSAQIASLPFIRNHDFARNGTKGLLFKAFRLFSDRLHGRLKKETVNLSLKYAILCLRFGRVNFKLTNHFCGDCLFFEYSDAIFKGRILQCRGRGSWGHNQTGHYRMGSKVHPGLIINEATSVFWQKSSLPRSQVQII